MDALTSNNGSFDSCLILFKNFPKFEIVFAIFRNDVFARAQRTAIAHLKKTGARDVVHGSLILTWIPFVECTEKIYAVKKFKKNLLPAVAETKVSK